MSTINITITANPEDFSTFADELGYQTMVRKSNEEIALLVEPISIEDTLTPNTQTKQQFLEDYFKGVVVKELYKQKALVIDGSINATKEAEKVALKSTLTNVVGVTSQV
jgi:hypothetical protein